MESTLPFEYGFLYKIIQNPNQSEINNSLKLNGELTGYFNNYNSNVYGSINSYGIDNTKYFHPIGYVETLKKVIMEVVVEETETTNGHLYMSGMSFNTTSVEKRYKKIDRAECEVNIFIRNFEKVL